MRCPYCGHLEDKVVDSRESRERDSIRRRRECLACNRRFTSYERVEEIPILLIKKDGRREPFEREKLLKGMQAACQKRPVSLARLEGIVADIQAQLLEQPEREISSRTLGDMVMDALKQVDSVAYVRFASIYRDFKDLPDFVAALESLMAGQALRIPESLKQRPADTPQSTRSSKSRNPILIQEETAHPAPEAPGERPPCSTGPAHPPLPQDFSYSSDPENKKQDMEKSAPHPTLPEPTPLFPGLAPTPIAPAKRRKIR